MPQPSSGSLRGDRAAISTTRNLAKVVYQIRTIGERFESILRTRDHHDGVRDRIQFDALFRLMLANHHQDCETATHLLRVSQYSESVANTLGLSASEAVEIRAAAPLYDLGKLGIPRALLCKPGPLSAEEYRMMQTRTLIGKDLLGPARSSALTTARTIALTHHERWTEQVIRRDYVARRFRCVAGSYCSQALKACTPSRPCVRNSSQG